MKQRNKHIINVEFKTGNKPLMSQIALMSTHNWAPVLLRRRLVKNDKSLLMHFRRTTVSSEGVGYMTSVACFNFRLVI